MSIVSTERLLRIIVIGDCNVGKTTLIHTLRASTVQSNHRLLHHSFLLLEFPFSSVSLEFLEATMIFDEGAQYIITETMNSHTFTEVFYEIRTNDALTFHQFDFSSFFPLFITFRHIDHSNVVLLLFDLSNPESFPHLSTLFGISLYIYSFISCIAGIISK